MVTHFYLGDPLLRFLLFRKGNRHEEAIHMVSDIGAYFDSGQFSHLINKKGCSLEKDIHAQSHVTIGTRWNQGERPPFPLNKKEKGDISP